MIATFNGIDLTLLAGVAVGCVWLLVEGRRRERVERDEAFRRWLDGSRGKP